MWVQALLLSWLNPNKAFSVVFYFVNRLSPFRHDTLAGTTLGKWRRDKQKWCAALSQVTLAVSTLFLSADWKHCWHLCCVATDKMSDGDFFDSPLKRKEHIMGYVENKCLMSIEREQNVLTKIWSSTDLSTLLKWLVKEWKMEWNTSISLFC